MANSWEDLDDASTAATAPPVATATWGSAATESVKESWDEDEPATAPKPAEPPKESKLRKKAIKEKEARDAPQVAAATAAATREGAMAEKLRQQKLVEENDLRLAQETFGGTAGEIDRFIPKSKDDFVKFAGMLAGKAKFYSSSIHYLELVREMIKLMGASMKSDDLRAVSHAVSALINDKLKEEKGPAKGKKSGSAAATAAAGPKRGAVAASAAAVAGIAGEDEEDGEALDDDEVRAARIEDQYDFM